MAMALESINYTRNNAPMRAEAASAGIRRRQPQANADTPQIRTAAYRIRHRAAT